MKVTFILKNLTDEFYEGGHGFTGLAQMDDLEKFRYLNKQAHGDLKDCVRMKTGSANAFRDQVELNQILRGGVKVEYRIEPRKGYRLATFNITSV